MTLKETVGVFVILGSICLLVLGLTIMILGAISLM